MLRAYYKISSVWNGRVLDLWGSPAPLGAKCHGEPFTPGYAQVCWELVVPVVAFPPGWFQIQSAETGDLLSHTYRCNPPVLVKPSVPAVLPQYRESWATQWAAIHAGNFRGFKCSTGMNTWCIKNRLTGGLLGFMYNTKHPFKDTPKVSGYCWDFGLEDITEHVWRLEIDPASNSRWKIIHHRTGFLLERTTNKHYRGTEVDCIDKKLPQGDRNKTWLLTYV